MISGTHGVLCHIVAVGAASCGSSIPGGIVLGAVGFSIVDKSGPNGVHVAPVCCGAFKESVTWGSCGVPGIVGDILDTGAPELNEFGASCIVPSDILILPSGNVATG